MVWAARDTDNGLLSAWGSEQYVATRSHARAYWRGTWLLVGCRSLGLDNSERQGHCNSRIRQRGARKGEYGCALIGSDIRGASGAGCRASGVQPLGKTLSAA